jgi:hypothetical protein
MTTLPRFRMKVAPRAPEAPEMTAGPSAPPAVLRLDLRADDPATSRKPGSFNYDRDSGQYPLEWANITEFDAWRRTEELANSIELIGSTVAHGGPLWSKRRFYVCSRQLSGGKSKYQKKHPERFTKIGSKKTGCDCKVVIKHYPHTPIILGRYEDEHNHEVGLANIAYMRMSQAARVQIRNMLEMKIDPKEIVRKWPICRLINADLIHLQVRVICNSAPEGSCDRFITLSEVHRFSREIEGETIQIHSEDAISIKLVIDQLKADGTSVFYKDKLDDPPHDSRLDKDAYVLCIQTRYQLDAFRRLGNGFIGIDATHNTTQYQDLQLFTIIARDRWGHGTSLLICVSGTRACLCD